MSNTNGGPAISSRENVTPIDQGKAIAITGTRDFVSNSSDGNLYDCTAAVTGAITLNFYPGMNWMKGISIMLPTSGATVSFNPLGAVKINGASTSLTRTLSSTQRIVSLIPRSDADNYDLTGS